MADPFKLPPFKLPRLTPSRGPSTLRPVPSHPTQPRTSGAASAMEMTVRDPLTGDEVSFVWHDKQPPSQADLAEVFAQAQQQPVTETASAPTGVAGFVQGLKDTLLPVQSLDDAKAVGSALYNDPVASIKAIFGGMRDDMIDQRDQATALFRNARGPLDYVEGAGHAAASLLPVIGPAAARAGETIGEGRIAEGLGQTTGLLAPLAAVPALRGARSAVRSARGVPSPGATPPISVPLTRAEQEKGLIGPIGKRPMRYIENVLERTQRGQEPFEKFRGQQQAALASAARGTVKQGEAGFRDTQAAIIEDLLDQSTNSLGTLDSNAFREALESHNYKAMLTPEQVQTLNHVAVVAEAIQKARPGSPGALAGVRKVAGRLDDATSLTNPLTSATGLLGGLMSGSGFAGLPGLGATWAAQGAGKIGISTVARLITHPEGVKVLGKYLRAVGTGKGAQINFWGARLSELAAQELAADTDPSLTDDQR